jgi:hypothetical protein
VEEDHALWIILESGNWGDQIARINSNFRVPGIPGRDSFCSRFLVNANKIPLMQTGARKCSGTMMISLSCFLQPLNMIWQFTDWFQFDRATDSDKHSAHKDSVCVLTAGMLSK